MNFRLKILSIASKACLLLLTNLLAQINTTPPNSTTYQASNFSLASDLLQPRIEVVPYPQALIKLGHAVEFGSLSFAGLLEVKNQKQFNRRLLPNHVWRGALFGEYIATGNSPIALAAGSLHESAHATMGIEKDKETLIDYLFDGQYRKYERNSIHTSMYATIPTYQAEWLFLSRMHYLIKSKNTPELSGLKTSSGWAYQLGTEARIAPYNTFKVKLSATYDRTLKGNSTSNTSRYQKVASDVIEVTSDYTIIAPVSSWTWATELTQPFGRYELGSFARFIVGHPGGYWDSRVRTRIWQIGFSAAF